MGADARWVGSPPKPYSNSLDTTLKICVGYRLANSGEEISFDHEI